ALAAGERGQLAGDAVVEQLGDRVEPEGVVAPPLPAVVDRLARRFSVEAPAGAGSDAGAALEVDQHLQVAGAHAVEAAAAVPQVGVAAAEGPAHRAGALPGRH